MLYTHTVLLNVHTLLTSRDLIEQRHAGMPHLYEIGEEDFSLGETRKSIRVGFFIIVIIYLFLALGCQTLNKEH